MDNELCCCLTEEMREQIRIDKEITLRLEQDRLGERKHIKLLLLGISESGKSTFIKQMRIIHGTGYKEEDRREFIPLIFENIFMAIQSLVEAMDTLKIEYADESCYAKADLIKPIVCQKMTTFHEPYPEAIKDIWNDSGLQQCYRRRNEFQLIDSAKYYLSDIDRIKMPDYLPTEQDVLRSRKPSTGIVEYPFVLDEVLFRIIDVGGQKSERRKWIHCFENVHSIIYLTALSEFDQVLQEDGETNRLIESLMLFKTIVESVWFKTASMILFLNKKDILEEKIMESNLVDYFPKFNGPPQDNNAARKFILNMFQEVKPVAERTIYPFYTCATDTENIKLIFESVKNYILQKNLKVFNLL